MRIVFSTSVAIVALFVGGCATKFQSPEAERAISSAAGLEQAIEFQVVAGPTDAVPPASDNLSFVEALRLAMNTHPEIQSALARVRAAEAEARQTRLLPNPILSLAVRFPEGGGSATIEAGLAADLVALLGRSGRISAADHRLRGACAEAISTALDVIHELRQAYVSAQALDELLPSLHARQALLDRLVGISESRLAAGEGTQLDVTTLQSQRVELELEIAQQQLAQREQRLALARLIGTPSAAADWRLDAMDAPDQAIADEKLWIAAALKHRPEIQAAQWELSALGSELSVQSLTALDGAEAGVEAEREDDWSVGPSISIPLPLLDWGQQRRAELRARRIEAGHRLTQQRRLTVEEVRRAHAGRAAIGKALAQAQGQLIPLTQTRLEQAEDQYQAGLADLTALVLAEQELRTAQARRIELQRDAILSLARLERASGGPSAVNEDKP